MRLLVIADTHVRSFKELPEKVVKLFEDCDAVVHAGDFTSVDVYESFSRKEVYAVYGNTDDYELKKMLPNELKFELEGVRFGLVHQGNYLNQFHDLGYKARELGIDFLIFGHIHRFVLEKFGDVVVLCPGSPTKPRLSAASIALIDVEDGRVNVKYEMAAPLACGMDVRLSESNGGG
jgi:hypothetical protein